MIHDRWDRLMIVFGWTMDGLTRREQADVQTFVDTGNVMFLSATKYYDKAVRWQS